MFSRLLITTLTAAAAVAAAGASHAMTQKPIAQGAEVTETATIIAIDSTARLVTIESAQGVTDTVYCGPDVKRFDELKVGDKITLRYYESMVFAVQPPGATPPAAEDTQITRSAGAKPGGTIARQKTLVVTVVDVDPAVPSIAIRTDDGRKMSFKVDDKKNIEGLKAGDKVQITFTQALAISIAPGS